MTRFSSMTIRTQLMALAIMLTLPALGIIVYAGLKERANDYNSAIIESQKFADSLADKQVHLVREARQFSSLLAELPEVQGGNGNRVQSILGNALKNNPQYQNILLADADGNVWVSALTIKEKYSVADRLYFIKAKASVQFTAGEYVVSRSTSKPTIHMASPLVYHGKFHGVVILSIDLDVMRSILGRLQLPDNANYVLVDRNGTIVARGRDLGENVGRPIKPEDLKIMAEGPEKNSYEFTRKDGDKRIVTYRKLTLEGESSPYMYVRAGLSLKESLAVANSRLLYSLGSLLPFVILTFVTVLVIGKKSITDRVEKLRVASHKIAEGDLEVRVSPFVKGGEFGELALSFDHMASRLADILTEKKMAEYQIKRLNSELEQKVIRRTVQLEALVKEQEAFNYSVSHDLRAPLRHINSYSIILSEELTGNISPQCHGYLQRILFSSKKMGELIDDLLSLSRINREQMKVESIDLSRIIADIILMLKETNPERVVEVIIAPDMMVKGDATLLRMVLQNLLDNAWKYTGKKPDARIEVGKTEINGEEVYYVKDNGAGFDMEYKDRLFAAFQRLHASNEYEGTGIGLATVARIIQRHNGKIWAEAKVSEGATFFFTLPKPEPVLIERSV